MDTGCAGTREFGFGSNALYFNAGNATNIGIVPTLDSNCRALFPGALNHACLITGAHLSHAHIHRYHYLDLAPLTRRSGNARSDQSW
ncbi:hypothetical protein LP414_06135 [Polaromonas sp. P1(28)-13]|nr:hypothetical protein LP414_06135 [Polaromonas sp. P1(28)-13]